ncbi:hypothetical protein QBC39DRAFT_409324 [Podospora conica]|nr:hypothetical protein QBC39DRAFT_409324 [Schizothecium conicum]
MQSPISMTVFLLLSTLTTSLAATLNPVHAVSPGELITPRQDVNVSIDKLGCGRFSTANHQDIDILLRDLHKSTKTDDCTTPAKTCRRHACINTSAIYVCNDNDEDLTLACAADVADYADWIFDYCCHNTNFYKGQSGQIFNDPKNYNVVIAYGNCRHDKDADHPSIGPAKDPWGPNGVCRR